MHFPGGVRYERTSRYLIKLYDTHTQAVPVAPKSAKRKAEKQVPISPNVDVNVPVASEANFMDYPEPSGHRPWELVTKRQRVHDLRSDDLVAEAWSDKHMEDLGLLSTTCIGEATTGAPKYMCVISSYACEAIILKTVGLHRVRLCP